MSQNNGLNRRAFLRNAGSAAFARAVGTGTSVATAAPVVTSEPPDGKYDFDTPYDRVGTDCIKWDVAIRRYGEDKIQVGMGIADTPRCVSPTP